LLARVKGGHPVFELIRRDACEDRVDQFGMVDFNGRKFFAKTSAIGGGAGGPKAREPFGQARENSGCMGVKRLVFQL